MLVFCMEYYNLDKYSKPKTVLIRDITRRDLHYADALPMCSYSRQCVCKGMYLYPEKSKGV